MAELGVVEQLSLHSRTSQYGQLTRSDAVDADPLREFADEQFEKIDNGEFAREFALERQMGYPVMRRLYEKFRQSDFLQDEQRTIDILGLDRDDGGE